MDYIKKSFKKIVLPTIFFVVILFFITIILTGLKRGLVNLDVRGFWGFNYPHSMPNPEHYTYLDELVDGVNMILQLVFIMGFRRYCLKKLNGEAFCWKDVFCFWTTPKLFFGALLCEYVFAFVISLAGVANAVNMIFNSSFLAVIGVFYLAISVGFIVFGVFLWLTPYIYSANIGKGIGYAFGNSFSVAKKYFWKILMLIVALKIIEMLVLFVDVLFEMLVGITLGYYILKKEQLIENNSQLINQE